MTEELLAALRWDTEYRNGRYADDPPLSFVAEILRTLDDHPVLRAATAVDWADDGVGC